MTEDKLAGLKAERDRMVKEKTDKELFERRLQEVQLGISAEEKRIQAEHQEKVDSESRTLRKENLGESPVYIRCFKCGLELTPTHLRQTIGTDGSANWYDIDAVCEECSKKVIPKNPENKRFCHVVSFALIKETAGSNYYLMRNG